MLRTRIFTTYFRTRHNSIHERRPGSRDTGLDGRRLARGLLGVPELLEFPHRVRQGLLDDDVVAVEHGARFVAADSHGHPLLHAGSDEVSDRRTPEVVKDSAG